MSPGLVGALAAGVAVGALVLMRIGRPSTGPWQIGYPDEEALREAGWTYGAATWELVRATVTIVAAALAISFGLPLPVGLLAAGGPSIVIRARARSARIRARRSLTRAASGVEAALRSGATLPDALRREAGACTEPIARDALRGALRSFDLGNGLDAALRVSAGRLRDRRSAILLETFAIGLEERLGTARLVELVGSVVDRLSFEQSLDDEIRARASGIRQQQWMLAGLVPAVALLLIGSMPSLADVLATPLGRLALIPGAIGLEIGGVLLSARLVDEALR